MWRITKRGFKNKEALVYDQCSTVALLNEKRMILNFTTPSKIPNTYPPRTSATQSSTVGFGTKQEVRDARHSKFERPTGLRSTTSFQSSRKSRAPIQRLADGLAAHAIAKTTSMIFRAVGPPSEHPKQIVGV